MRVFYGPWNSQPSFRRCPRGYIAFVEELPGANTQAATLDEARTNLKEAVALVLEANRTLCEESI
jgi:predicted RNase H-like HicB family nuclease